MGEFISVFLLLTGYIVGLGAVTVIDLHGFLARKSSYWTEATIRSHKITKPLIWIGIFFVITGSTSLYYNSLFSFTIITQYLLYMALILNGLFLSFIISPELLRRELKGKAKELLPQGMQKKITIAFIVSFLGWWGSVLLTVWNLLNL